MRVLALDTTTRAGSAAIVDDDRVVCEQVGDPRRSHAERLPGDLLRVLDASGLTMGDVDLFAIAAGPASFTGLRIGIATIQGLAVVTGKRVVSVSTLAALAEAGSHEAAAGAIVGVWMDAHRHDVFSALFRVADVPAYSVQRLIELDAAAVGEPAATGKRWESLGAVPSVLVGDGAVLYGERHSAGARIVAPPPIASIVGRMAVARARAGEALAPAGVQPLYIRRPDVEIAREAFTTKDTRDTKDI
jgi:tRNA threonylcarbamoyladenosine biosynthesis protein TsaB